jgi:hypothetical protein
MSTTEPETPEDAPGARTTFGPEQEQSEEKKEPAKADTPAHKKT